MNRNDGDKYVLRTYTDADGKLESLEVTENAGWGDRARHRLDRWLPNLTFLSWSADALLILVDAVISSAAEPATGVTPVEPDQADIPVSHSGVQALPVQTR